MLQRIIVFIFLLAGTQLSASAQKDPKAKVILDGVSEKYQSLKGLQASFVYSYQEPGDRGNQSQSGEIAVKGDKYYLKLPDQEIFNNGKTVWTYITSGNYKEVTINNAGEIDDELTPSSIYSMYQKGYNYKLLGEKTENGTVIQEIELISENPGSSAFQKVKLLVDKNKKDLAGWEIHDDQGGIFKYNFKSVNTEINLPDNYFNFNPQKYGKIEVIDLR